MQGDYTWYASIERNSRNGREKAKKKVNCWWMNGWRWWWCDKQAGGSVQVWGPQFSVYTYVCVWMCVSVCVCVISTYCVREREREKLQENIEMQITVVPFFFLSCHYPLPFSPQFPLSLSLTLTLELPQRAQHNFSVPFLFSSSFYLNGEKGLVPSLNGEREWCMCCWFGLVHGCGRWHNTVHIKSLLFLILSCSICGFPPADTTKNIYYIRKQQQRWA